MNKSTYKLIDLCVFTLLTVLLELLNLLMIKAFNEVFALSIMLPMTALIMMRWGAWAIIPAALSGVVFASVSGGGDLYLIYSIGNCFIFMALWLALSKKTRQKIITSYPLTAAYFLAIFVSVNLGRAIIAAILDYSFIDSLLKFMLSELFNFVIGLIIMFAIRRQNGLFENQNDYLLRINKEQEMGNI